MCDSLQVSVCWCLMGGSRKTLPGKCIWSSTRRTAGEGPSLRRCSLLLRLLAFNISTRRTASLISLPATLSPPFFAVHAPQTDTHRSSHTENMQSHVQYTYTCTDADISPTSMGSLLILQSLQGRTWCVTNTLAAADRLHYCLKQLSQLRNIHSMTLVACFVFVDITVTISLSYRKWLEWGILWTL